jgi:hypothetical protein
MSYIGTVKQLRDALAKYPDDMEVVGLGDTRTTQPAEVYVDEGNYDPESSEWDENGDKVVVLQVSH